MRFFLVTLAGSVLLLAVDVTPGLLCSGLLCPCVSFVLLTLASCGWSVTGWAAVSDPDTPARRRRWLYVAGALAVVTVLLWLADIPRRIALWAVRREFEALLAGAPQGKGPLGRRVGCFYVDEYGTDDEGGVYFRTASHPDGIGPDTMSYGFAYRPHPKLTPFGGAGYKTVWLFGDWYWFMVSDD